MKWPKKWRWRRWWYKDRLESLWWLMWFVACNWICHYFLLFPLRQLEPETCWRRWRSSGRLNSSNFRLWLLKKRCNMSGKHCSNSTVVEIVEFHVSYRRVLHVCQILHGVRSSAQSWVGAEWVHWPVCSTEVKGVTTRLPPHLQSASRCVPLPPRNGSNTVFPKAIAELWCKWASVSVIISHQRSQYRQ